MDHPANAAVCSLCDGSVRGEQLPDGAGLVHCETCGDYEITSDAWHRLVPRVDSEYRYLLSGRTKTSEMLWGVRHRVDIEQVKAMQARALRPKMFSEKMELAMRWIEKHQVDAGQECLINEATGYTAAYCRNRKEFGFVVVQLRDMGYVTLSMGRGDLLPLQIQAKGWQYLEDRVKKGAGSQAFVAMSFAPEMAEAEAAIIRGVAAAGYEPILVKYEEFTDGIMDRILAGIRRSRFMVADFTENKAGVYYEAGCGQGLGLTVVGTCRGADIPSLHFDVKHLNMIPWAPDALDKFSERIAQRIRAVVGQGPLARPS